MGFKVLHLFTPLIAPPSSPPAQPAAQRFSATRCRFSARYGGRSGRATRSNERPKFDEDYRTFGDYDDNDVFGFSTSANQRVWWTDDESSWNADYYDDDDDDDDDGFGPFGVLESSIGFTWIFKLVRSFGWMLPAIIISILLGTGPNTMIMALVLPIAQSALSLVLDTFWEGSNDRPSARPKSRSKKRPFTRPASNSEKREKREREEYDTQTSRRAGDSQSWEAANHVSGKKGERTTQSFGGWDELDKPGRMDEVPKRTPFQNANGPTKQKKSKLSKRVGKRDSPLLIRLLIAVFPIFGFWTKLM